MDFEIEDSGEYDYSHDYAATQPKKAKASMFGGNLENSGEEDIYNYEFDDTSNKKKSKPASKYQEKSKYDYASETKPKSDLRVSISSNNSAMEKAQSLLNRYSQQGSLAQPKSNFKKGKMKPTFDEDDISISMDDEDDESKKFNTMSYDDEDFSVSPEKPKANRITFANSQTVIHSLQIMYFVLFI